MTRYISSLSAREAREFLLKDSSFDNDHRLPGNLRFAEIFRLIENQRINDWDFLITQSSLLKGLEFEIFNNGKPRKIEVINPLHYFAMVEFITESNTWEYVSSQLSSSKIEIIQYSQIEFELLRLSEPIVSTTFRTSAGKVNVSYSDDYKHEVLKRIDQRFAYFDIQDFYNSIRHEELIKVFEEPLKAEILIQKIDSAESFRDFDQFGPVGSICKCLKIIRLIKSKGLPVFSMLTQVLSELVLNKIDADLAESDELKCGLQVIRYKDDYYFFEGEYYSYKDHGLFFEEIGTEFGKILGRFSLMLNPDKSISQTVSLETLYSGSMNFNFSYDLPYYALIELTKIADSLNEEFLNKLLELLYSKESLKISIQNTSIGESCITLLMQILNRKQSTQVIIGKLCAQVVYFVSNHPDCFDYSDWDPIDMLISIIERKRSKGFNLFLIHFFNELGLKGIKGKNGEKYEIQCSSEMTMFYDDLTFKDLFINTEVETRTPSAIQSIINIPINTFSVQ